MNADLVGNGAGIAIRGYENVVEKKGAQNKQSLFFSTEDKPVSGKLTDYTQELVIPCFSRKTSGLIIFVVMKAGTSGTVSFKNIELEVKAK